MKEIVEAERDVPTHGAFQYGRIRAGQFPGS
ncbi:hypothetical protein ABIE69_000447 [Rhodobacteraceae bacterium MBR-64]|jgi:hypothetical protein